VRTSWTPPEVVASRIAEDVRALAAPSVATMRKERRHWSARLRTQPAEYVLAVAVELFERFHHRWIAYELVEAHPSALQVLDAERVERFAGQMRSWGEVDQFGVLLAGPAWRASRIDDRVVHGWARRPDRWWRRAALVATVPLNTRSRGGVGDTRRTLGVCELLVHDRDQVVTRALSWALRELIIHDRPAVEAFLAAHDDVLPARVKREVRNKLTTGRKNPGRSEAG
jgi:3-methyladenine DNA glycosylase AlkD